MKIFESKMRWKMKKTNSLVFCLAMVSVAFMAMAFFGVAPVSARTYTTNADFDEGLLVGVEHDTVPDQLQLSKQQETLPFIWVANSGESTVSKIDTATGVELGRYRTGPGTGSAENPSRTTVDVNGDLWVGNRNSNTAVKIALYPTDTTGGESPTRPDIFTPTDSIPDGTLTTSTGPLDVKPWGQDDAVLMRIAVDPGPRALAVDASNNVWIGGSGGQTMGYYNGETGANLKNIYIGRSCYGALVDGNGTLWISNQDWNTLTRIDDPSGSHTITTIGANGYVYGIGIDSSGYIYTSGWSTNQLRKYDPVAKTWVYQVGISGANGRGVCVGLDGDVWVAQSGSSRVTRHNPETGAVINTILVGDTPTGVAVDAAGKIWVTNYGSSNIMRIDPATNSVDFTQEGHTNPYNYSDMTGIIARTITTKTGTWTVDYDSGSIDTPWGTISWASSEPAGTSVTVQVRSSNDKISWSLPEAAGDGIPLSSTPAGRYIQVEATLQIISGDVSPILFDLTVLPANEPPVADAGPDQTVEQESYAGTEVTLDGSGSTDPDSTPGTNDDIIGFEWFEGATLLGIGETINYTFPLGSHTVTLKVTDSFGETDEDEVIITVEDTIAPEVDCCVNPDVLWPPNHKMVPVIVFIGAQDICTEPDDLVLLSVTAESSQPDDDKGDGAFTGDVDGEDGYTSPVDVSYAFLPDEGGFVGVIDLRAERDGRDADRIYTITATVKDVSDNETTVSCEVIVPHDQGKGKK